MRSLNQRLSNSRPYWGTYAVTDTTTAIDATHWFSAGTTIPNVQVTAATEAYGNIAALTLTLPPTQALGTPPAPVDLTATESNANEVDLAWTYDTNLASSFTVSVTDAAGDTTSTTVDPNTMEYAATGLEADENYTFSVVANVPQGNGTDEESTAATIVSAAASAGNLWVTGPTSANENGDEYLSIASDASANISGWTIAWTDQNGVPIATQNLGGSTETQTLAYPVPPSGTAEMTATISAVDSANNSFTLPAFAVVVTPIAPSGLAAVSDDSTDVTVWWLENSAAATNDIVYESINGGGTFFPVDEITANEPGWGNSDYLSGLTEGTQYEFYVTADNGYAESAPSNVITVTTPLETPSGLTATVISSSEIDLSWTNNSAAATGVDILISTDGINYYQYDSVSPAAPGSPMPSTYAAVGLDSGTTYYFEVQAIGATASSSPSGAQSATTSGIPEPEDVTATAVSPNEVDLIWDDPSGQAASFDVQRSSDGGNSWDTIASGLTATAGSNTYADTLASDGTDYLYEITGYNSSSIASNPSESAEAVTPLVTPSDVNVVASSDSDGVDATITWQEDSSAPSDEIQFEIDRSTDDTNWSVVTVTDAGDTSDSYTDTGLLGQTDYYYQIQAINDVSDSAYTASYELTTPLAVPAVPISLAASGSTDDSVSLNWAAGTDPGGAVAGYTVDVSGDEGQTFNQFGGELGASATSVAVTGLNSSTLYLFEVSAVNAAGSSYPAGPVGAQTTAPPQGVFTLAVSTNTQSTNYTAWTSAHLSWTYSGQDQPTLEFEYEDQTMGVNFQELGALSMGPSGSNWATAYGLNPGDTYGFRLRADFADDTVSAWSAVESFTPAVLTAPSVTVTPYTDCNGIEHLLVGWSGVPSGYSGVQIEFTSDAVPDDGWTMYNPDPSQDDHYPVDTNDDSPLLPSGDQGFIEDPGVIAGAGSYTYRVCDFASTGQPSGWSSTQSGSLAEGTAPTLTDTASATSITLSWTGYADANSTTGYSLNIQQYVPGQLTSFYPSYQTGSPLSVGTVSGTSDSSTSQAMSCTLPDLQPAATYCYILEADYGDGPMGFGRDDVKTLGSVVPNSTGPLNAAWSASAGGVAMYWGDGSDNDSGFLVQRSVDDVNFTNLAVLGTDQNSYVDTSAGPDSVYFYRVCAVGDSSGNYNSGYTTAVAVNTPGVSIDVQGQGTDPAGNPEIWLDSSERDPTTGAIDPPSSDADPYLVPVTANVPLGADNYGTATLTWSASIRLYNDSGGTLTQVGTIVNDSIPSVYSLTWGVSPSSSSESFLAQGVSGSATLGDQGFALTTNLTYVDAATGAGNPTTNPSATRPTTQPFVYITSAQNGDVDNTQAVQAIEALVGEQIAVTGHCGPGQLFPAAPQYVWQIPGNTVKSYTQSIQKTDLETLPASPTTTNGPLTFYWIDGSISGQLMSVKMSVKDSDGASVQAPPQVFSVYKPATLFFLTRTSDSPPVQVSIYKYREGLWLHDGGALPFTSDGINVTGIATSPPFANSAGTIAWTQLISGAQLWRLNGENSLEERGSSTYDLDNVIEQFSTAIPGNAANIQITLQNHWGDSPGIVVNPLNGAPRDFAEMSLTFEDYITYQPMMANSIPVTLGYAQWGVDAEATRDPATGGYDLSDVSYSPLILTTFANSSSLPQWSSNYIFWPTKTLT